MSHQTPSVASEIETLREAYASLNRNDIPATVNLLDPKIEWIEPDEYPIGGTHRGRADVQAHLQQARDTWAEGRCEPQRFIAAGDKIVVFLHVHVKLKGHTDWIDGDIADVYTFRHGKAIQMRHFSEREQALEWAGVETSETN